MVPRRAEEQLHHIAGNLDPDQAAKLTIKLEGIKTREITARILTADAMNAHNTFEHPDGVRPTPFHGARLEAGRILVELPAKAVVVLELR